LRHADLERLRWSLARVCVASAAVALTVACTSTLVDYSEPVHIVQPGETLYSIAWRHGLDHHQLAAWNQLDNPDLLMIGQRLRLRPSSVPASRGAAAAPAPSRETASARAAPTAPSTTSPAPSWRWPTQGPLLRRFGDRGGLSNGIGIGGRVGQDVRAAAAGRVVYAGNGLQAYGQLVIVNHNNSFLSAYGYNDGLVVSQGDEVAAGQLIARMGLGPERRAQLHFEIRRNGAPVDPLAYLPR